VQFVFFGINALGQRCLDWLAESGDRPALTVTDKPSYKEIKAAQADMAVSVGYRHILPPDVLALFPQRIVNLHTGYLPSNRGRCPNVWPLIDGTPAGVTIHYMDDGVDTGSVIGRSQVEVMPWDTAESLFHRLEESGFDLFRRLWPAIRTGQAKASAQRGRPTSHKFDELDRITFPDLDAKVPVRDVLNALRARTFPPYDGLIYMDGNHLVEARIELRPYAPRDDRGRTRSEPRRQPQPRPRTD